MNVAVQTMDWSTVLTRRNVREFFEAKGVPIVAGPRAADYSSGG